MLFDLWLVVVTLLFFTAAATLAVGYDRMMGTKR
jgi:hypothetical protein